jgi:hypothetical protein
MLFKYIILCAVVIIFVSSPTKADDLDVDFSGFATLTKSYSDNPDIGFSSNYLNASETGFSFRRDSILGGQANITINNDWDAVVQAIYQDRSIKTFDNFILDVPANINPAKFTAVVVWCETFSEFITAATYQ